MTRKLIVFTEGKRDTQFLETLCERCLDDPTIERLDMEDESGEGLISRETNKIDRFTDPWNEWDLLLKSEGGKSKLLKAFPQLLFDIYDAETAFCLVLDLDAGETPDAESAIFDVTETINERLQTSTHRNVEIEVTSQQTHDSPLVCCGAELLIGGTTRRTFPIIAFTSSLETVAAIDKSGDDSDEQEQKARALADERPIREPLERTLFE